MNDIPQSRASATLADIARRPWMDQPPRAIPRAVPRPTTPFDISVVESDVREALRVQAPAPERSPEEFAPRARMPDYVEHLPDVSDVGRLTAEAIIRDFEAASQAIEAMGKELIENAKRADEMAAGCRAALEEVTETAARHREEGKRIFLQIERTAQMTADVRKTCNALREQLAAS